MKKQAAFRGVLVLFGILGISSHANAQLVNPGFESGDTTGWMTLVEGAANPVVVDSGSVAASAGTINPSLTGDFYAYTSQASPGRSFLYQDFVVQAGTNRIFFDIAINNAAGDFFVPSPISFDFSGAANQQARFDILRPGASVTTEDPSDIIVVGFQTQPGDPTVQDWTRYDVDVSSDLAPFVGQTVTLRFIQVDNQFFFNLGLDNVSVGSTPPPGVAAVTPEAVPVLPAWALVVLAIAVFGTAGTRRGLLKL